MITGYAWQKGMLPLSRDAILGAIELNGIAVDWNKQAFEWGRALAHEPELQRALLKPKADVITLVDDASPQPLEAHFAGELEGYHNRAYATAYESWLSDVAAKIEARVGSQPELSDALARALYKLMAYKDEYEVARLHSAPEFLQSLSGQFEGDYKLAFYLAPPLISKMDQATGRPQKIRFGSWMLPAKFKFLRHTPFDPFGYTEERRLERRLIEEYKTTIEDLVSQLTPDKVDELVTLAGLPMTIRGYGHVKLASVERYQAELRERLTHWQDLATQAAA
jgi:indolepyruvate ferredoxin oxidoreductase